MALSRLDRQLRIEGWNQTALDEAALCVVGDDDLLASLFVMSAAALGLNRINLIAPTFDQRLMTIARQINPDLDLTAIEAYFTHPALDDLFTQYNVLVDLSQYGLANKLVIEKGLRENVPVVRGFVFKQNDREGFTVFTYRRGREWDELYRLISPRNLPGNHFDDGALDIIIAGMALEETKNLLMGRRTSKDLIAYRRRELRAEQRNSRICVVGAGALGNFVGLGLALSGYRNITFIDPDVVEVANLNRQVLFGDAVGQRKAEASAERLNRMFRTDSRPEATYFRRDTDISEFDVIFDCVDNFETRIVLSEICERNKKVLISGGSGVESGQVIVYEPGKNSRTPADLLGLYDIVDRRNIESYRRIRASCTYGPDPSVIMTNQIIAGFMVDSYRMLLTGLETPNIFYNAAGDKRIWRS
jgi:molybdopterin/thiamine biosynthesis adenylyltransferase